MKLTTQRMFGWQTSCLHAGVVMLGFALATAIVTAQESKPADKAVKPANVPADPARSTAAKAVADSKMPDISGTWVTDLAGNRSKVVIRRILDDDAFLVTDHPDERGFQVRWSRDTQRFEEAIVNVVPKPTSRLILQLLPDDQTMRVTISLDEQARKEHLKSRNLSDSQLDERLNRKWTRSKSPVKSDEPTTPGVGRSAEFAQQRSESKTDAEMTPLTGPSRAAAPEAGHIKVFTLANGSAVEFTKLLSVLYEDVKLTADPRTNSIIAASPDEGRLKYIEAILLRLDEAPSTPAAPKTDAAISFTPAAAPSSSGIPNTPAAKQLVEQLDAQESAAAAEAATIRQLRANGQAEQNQQPIAEHQRKLKNLLSTAFDLKLQLEELQVKELQSRLSRLERQIGQRKELREKIIARRASELIDGDVLRWTLDASRINQDTTSKTRGETSSTSTTASPPKADQIVIDLYGGSKVLPGLSENPKYAMLIQSLNGLKGVVTNFRESGPGTTISMAIVRDPSGRLLREIRPNEMASELHGFIRLFLTRAGIQNVRWEGHLGADVTSPNKEASDLLLVSPNAPKMVSQREATHQVTIDFPIANFPVIPGDRIEAQHVLHAEEGFHGPGKTIASGLEVVGVARSLSLPTRTALTLATTPEMAAMLEHLATTGLLFCHPLDPVAMLPCGRAVRIPLGIRQEGRLTVGDAVRVDRMSLAIAKNNLAEPKFVGFAYGLLIGFEEGDIPEGTTEPKTIVKLLLPNGSNIDAHVFQNNVDELIKNGSLFRGKRSERGDATQFHVAVTEIEWQIESLEKRIAYYQEHVINNPAPDKVQLNLGYQRIRLEQLKAQRELYKTSSDVMARVRPLNSAANDEPSPP